MYCLVLLHPLCPQDYELHKNDCRHYINCLVRYTTGREHAASAMLKHQWQRARECGKYGLAHSVVRAAQFFTDLANWGKVQVGTQCCTVLASMGVSCMRCSVRAAAESRLPGRPDSLPGIILSRHLALLDIPSSSPKLCPPHYFGSAAGQQREHVWHDGAERPKGTGPPEAAVAAAGR